MPASEATENSFEAQLDAAPKGFINEFLAKQRAFHFRSKSLESLDKQILDFEGHFAKHRGKIIWAPSADSALEELGKLAGQGQFHTRKHRLLNEIGFQANTLRNTHFIDEDNLQATRPKVSAEDTALLFPEFYVSENGALVLSQTDPYVGHLMSTCERVIFLIGIEQIAASLAETEVLLSLLKRYRNANHETGSYHVCFGPSNGREIGSSQEHIVIFLDNGRTNILEQIPQRQALYCIHCGACESVSNLKHAEQVPIIDAIKAPFIHPGPKSWMNTFHFPLSKRANHSCPVNIDLKQLLLTNRKLAVDQKTLGRSDNMAWGAWKKAMLSRKWLNQGSGLKQFTLKSFYKGPWGEQRSFPKIADKSFNQWWVETRGKGGLD